MFSLEKGTDGIYMENLIFSCQHMFSATDLCKQFGPRTGPTFLSNLFDTLMIFLKDFTKTMILKKSTADNKSAADMHHTPP